ncbi:MAG: hypothetical protein ACKVQA_25410 [Burkholderiales bacterium]
MSEKRDVEKDFRKDIASHVMTIKRNDGLYRHLEFRKPNHGWHHWFEIVTWPNGLIIRGDMETWVFSRVEDMFNFFRGDRINAYYWQEKLQCARDDAKEFSADVFRSQVIGRLDNWDLKPDQLKQVLSDLDDEVFGPLEDDRNEHKAYELLYRFSSGDVSFGCDLPDGKEWSYHYLWCLHAIVWGIQQYDKGQVKP